jgi:hypothetical protein
MREVERLKERCLESDPSDATPLNPPAFSATSGGTSMRLSPGYGNLPKIWRRASSVRDVLRARRSERMPGLTLYTVTGIGPLSR